MLKAIKFNLSYVMFKDDKGETFYSNLCHTSFKDKISKYPDLPALYSAVLAHDFKETEVPAEHRTPIKENQGSCKTLEYYKSMSERTVSSQTHNTIIQIQNLSKRTFLARSAEEFDFILQFNTQFTKFVISDATVGSARKAVNDKIEAIKKAEADKIAKATLSEAEKAKKAAEKLAKATQKKEKKVKDIKTPIGKSIKSIKAETKAISAEDEAMLKVATSL